MYEKCIIFTILFVLFSVPCSFVFASADTPSTTGAFVTTWETTAPNESVTIPVGGSSSIYTINWGDGTVNTNVSGNQTHQYAALGNHTVSISGNFSKIALGGDSTNAAKLRSIDQWGSTGWTSMDGAFDGASNMIYNATDSPDLLHVTNMSSMFEDAISFDGDLSGWNVSSVTDMSSMFLNADSFTGDLSGWDVSSVTDMSRMFMSADSFTGDLSGWNVSSVTDMSYMFWFATNFTSDLSEWDVSSVTDMSYMFEFVSKFTSDLSEWDVSRVTNMRSMFTGATVFTSDLSEWDVSRVTNMRFMFSGANSFNSDISNWNVSSATDMTGVISNNHAFVQNLGKWYVVLDDTTIDAMDLPRIVGHIAPQTTALTGSRPIYAIGTGGDSESFRIIARNILWMYVAPDKALYSVNITYGGGSLGTNNHRVYDITVTSIDTDSAIAPTLASIERHSPADQNTDSQTLVYKVTFSEDVTGVNTGDFVLSQGSAGAGNTASMTGSGSVYYATVSATQDGTYNLDLVSSGHDIVDATDNPLSSPTPTGADHTYTVTLQVTITDSPNSPPTVNAGQDQEVAEGATVSLSGTVSDDDPGDTPTHEWTHDGPSGITFANPAALSTTFAAPDVAANTTFTVTLTANDGTVEVSDALQVTIADSPNSPPTVNAGQDQEVAEGATVSLSGTVSDDDPGDTPTHEWTHDGPSGITFANPAALSTTFAAPDVAANTTFTVTLTANDGTVEVSDALQVTIADSPNSPPTVNAGQDQEVAEGATVSLSGTVSDDDPGDTPTHEWTHDGPSGITFANPAALSTTFAAPDVAANTTFTVTLTANDGTVEVSDALQVTIADSPNSPPTVNAGQDQEVAEGATVSLSGTVSDDDPGDTPTHEWTHDGPSGITFANPAALSTTFAAPDVAANTTITVTLTVNDGTVEVSDALQVTITDSPNSPPAADAGLNLTAADGITDTGTLKLLGARGIAIFESGSSTYAAVIAYFDNGVQVLDVTDPSAITAAGSITDDAALKLAGASGIAVFESGGSTYAAVASSGDNGVQILDVTDPSAITAAGSIANTATLELRGALGIATFESGGSTYAAVASSGDNGVQILDVTDPSAITAAGSITDTGTLKLLGARAIATFESGGSTYAAVAAEPDDGVQILNITDPSDITAAGSIADTDDLKLAGAYGITVFKSGGSTYAAVASSGDNGVQILDVTDPSDITAAGSIADTDDLKLAGASGITVFESGGSTYAAVASYFNNGVQILDVTDPSAITATDNIGDTVALELAGAEGIAVFESGGSTYAAVASSDDNGVQILRLTGGAPPVTPNSPPAVEAGADQEVAEGATVSLSGTASDSDNDPLTYMWTHDSALSITLADDTAISTTFTAPAVTQDTTIIFTLAVSDDTDSVTDTVSVTITDTTSSNSPPTVEAGPDQTVDEGDAVTLSGTASDSDNDPLTYMWTHDSALSITLADDTAISTTFTAPAVTQDTTIIFTLAVSDDADSVTDTVSVTIANNSPPTVNAGQDQEVAEGATVTLSGTASDSDNDPLTYMWTHDSALSITLADDTAISTTFTAPAVTQDTTIIFTLAVSDDADSVTDTVSVTITDTTSSNSPPTVEAGPDQTVDEGDAVTLSGTASDSDNDPLTYMWTHDSALSITLADDTAISTTFTAPAVTQDTTIIFTLAVSDDADSVTDTVSVTITNNTPPTVEAGPDQTVDEGDAVSLSGTVSDDDPGDTPTHEWTHDGPSGITFANPAALSTTFAAPDVAANTTITVTLTVNDGTVEVSDALQVTITDSPNSPPAADAGLNLTAADGITDTGTLKLLGARGIAIFESGSSTYAAVIAYFDNGVQVLDVTDPSAITAAGSITDDAALKLAGASGIAVFESGGSTYAAVASSGDNGVQILDVTDPSAITAAGSIANTATLELRGALGIATFESGGSTYAAVASSGDNGVQILDVTDPSAITAAGSITDTGTLKLLGARAIATFESGGSTYAAVAAEPDDGVQILNITDPSDITAAGSIADTDDLKLAGAYGITVFKSGGSTYAAVASSGDNGVQILDVTDPSDITAAGSIADTDDLKLAGASGITVFESGGSTYAAVASYFNNGVQILDVTDPSAITATDNIGDTVALELAGAEGIAVFESGGSTYAAVASSDDNGVQILRLTGGAPPVTPNSPPAVEAGADQEVAEGATVSLSGTASDSDNDPLTYMWTHDSALSITLADDTAISTTFTAPAVTQDTTIIFTLAVSDDTDSVTDTVSVTIANNSPPTVNAGQDQEVAEGATVTLSGTASDSDNDPLTYMWTHDSALSITLADDTAISTTFTAPAVTQDTTIIFTLAVSDDTDSVTDTVSVTITDTTSSNSPPTVEAGPDQTVDEGDAVTLSGTASDSDNDPLTYMWTHDSALSITLADDTAISTTFTAPAVTQDTTIIFTLAVSDDADSVTDTVSVTITNNTPPTVEAGPDQTVDEGATVTLSGTVSDDDPEDALTYEWTHDSALAIAITGSDSASASFAAPDVAANTTITVTLTVNDGTVEVSDALQVTITDSPSIPPAADAGLNLTAAGGITDTGTLKLLGARGIAIFESGSSTYAAVIAYFDNGVQVLDVTDPSAITAAGGISDTDDLKLAGASGIAVFESGGSTYAAVASLIDDGVQILNITDPSAITATDNIGDTAALELRGALGIATFESGGSTYAAVASSGDNGVQILDVTDPSAITAAGSITDTGTLKLLGARAIATFESGGSTYAAVAAEPDDGVQILNITDPSDITAAGSIADTDDLELAGAYGITVFKSGGSTYAAVASSGDNGVQILDVTDPSDITAAGGISDTDDLKLAGASSITVFESGGSTYAAVASYFNNGVQILDVTDPSAITATDNIGDTVALELAGAEGIAVFESGGSTYAAVASSDDNGVQILRLTGGIPPR